MFSGCVRRAAGSAGDGDASALPLPEACVRVREARRERHVPRAGRRARRARAAGRAPPLETTARLAAGRTRQSECHLERLLHPSQTKSSTQKECEQKTV